MPRPWTKSLTLDESRELRRACRDNADDLTDNARLLFQHARFPAAFTYAYLTLEDLAKARALLCIECAITDGDAIDWLDFWKGWRQHPVKSVSALASERLDPTKLRTGGMVMLSTPASQQVVRMAEALQKRREASLYVDWDGTITTPRVSVDEAAARELMERAQAMVAVHDELEALLTAQPIKAREILLNKFVVTTRRRAQPKV